MALDRLDTPLRVTWALADTLGPMPAEQARCVAERLVDAGVFFVTLEGAPFAHPALPELLAVLTSGAIDVQALFAGSAAEWQGLAATAHRPGVLLDVGAALTQSRGDLQLLRDWVARLRQQGCAPTFALVPERRWLSLLPQLFDLARELGIGKFKLPNTGIDASVCRSGREALLGPDDVAMLRKLFGDDPVQLRRDLQLEVHDLFIWELLFPGEREAGRAEYGGCQAANSLGHIDARAQLHPCSSWPSPLGSLLTASIEALWASPQREQIRTVVAAMPSECCDCRDLALCLGGCRGLAQTCAVPGASRDLLCPGPRR